MVKKDIKKKEETESDVSEEEEDAKVKKDSEPVSDDSNESDQSNEDDVADEEEKVDTGALKDKVSKYIKLDDQIREKKEEIKDLQEKKVEFEEYIRKYLEKANKTKIETNDGEIVFKQQSSKAPLKEELIEKAIVKKFQDAKKVTESGVKIAHDILEEVGKMRGISVKNNIRRIKKKEQKKKK